MWSCVTTLALLTTSARVPICAFQIFPATSTFPLRTTARSSSLRLLRATTGGSSGDDKPDNDGLTEDEILNNPMFTQFLDQLVASGAAEVIDVPVDGSSESSGGSGGGGGSSGKPPPAKSSASDNSLESLLSFDLKPKEVVEYLDRFVIKQSEAKKVLAVAICDHYNHCRRCLQETYHTQDKNDDYSDLLDIDPESSSASGFDYAKPNVLLAGPTGVGKTYLLKCLAKLVGVPFVKADATKFSETGIVGRDAEDLVRDLVDKANGNTTLASVGIIYLDEVDKIAGNGGNGDTFTKGSFNTKGVQNNFLKLLEDTEVSLERQQDMVISNLPGIFGGGGQPREKTISTRNILFIFSGAFTNLDADIKRKKSKRPFGLDTTTTQSARDQQRALQDENENGRSFLRYAETADFINAGLEPEFVGRVPVRVALDSLTADDLKQILVAAQGSVLKQFIRDMEGYGITMNATDTALDEIAALAEKEKTGARGLVTILERTLRQHKYELPSTSLTTFVLDKATVINPELELNRLLASKTSTDDDMGVLLRDLKRWETKLNSQLPSSAQSWFTDEAINYIVLKSLEADTSAYSYASRHFGDSLLRVIQRIHESTSQTLFPITIEIAKDPKSELKKWLELLK